MFRDYQGMKWTIEWQSMIKGLEGVGLTGYRRARCFICKQKKMNDDNFPCAYNIL